jgi:hypothetical protein
MAHAGNIGFASLWLLYLAEHLYFLLTFVLNLSFVLSIPQRTQSQKPLHGNGPERQPEKKIDSVCLALFTDRQAPIFYNLKKIITISSARITISLRHYS